MFELMHTISDYYTIISSVARIAFIFIYIIIIKFIYSIFIYKL